MSKTTLPKPRFNAEELVAMWRQVPHIDGVQLRRDIADVLDLDLQ
jgi:hypothetical protein